MVSVSVIGSGAVGKFYGGLFVLAGCHVSYLERSDYLILQERNYYEIELPNGQILKITPSQVVKNYMQLPKSDIILVALKTTENSILKEILPCILKPESKILMLQNGIGNEEFLSTFIKNHSIVCGVTTIGATRINPGHVQIKHFGELKLAPFANNTISDCDFIKQHLCTNLSPELCPTVQFFENHRVLRWTKLLWNTTFSSLSLVFNTSVDKLSLLEKYQSIVRAMMHEVSSVAKKDGAEIENTIDALIDITKGLKEYYPSMYYDLKQGKPIESEYIVSNVIDYGLSRGCHIPYLSLIYQKLKLLEKRDQWFSALEQEEISHELSMLGIN
ncbi:Probable 2-dehydropantoate 2-reductase [Legionella wadsworthii]|uniref:2-dehydropantoate 2-reductase n=1 Tax=Legionella wadsworthii TaxID=28088 RepID=A0A378LNE5_9GAMM|nr:2-dehydropantoate 2-reductase [Legionella wadsworthii]STY28505.1 Probable 2-dehydropantoate 2-reductase [Legionella wadsworthii]